MNKLSTGEDSTLGNWRKLVSSVFGEGPALRFIDRKIAESPVGENEEVITSEQQLLHVLGMIELKARGEE